MEAIELLVDKVRGEAVPEESVAGAAGETLLSLIIAIVFLHPAAAGRKPQREVTLLPPRMFLSTPAPVTTWEGELGQGLKQDVIIDAKVC